MLAITKVVINPFEKAPNPDEPLQMVIARKEVMDLDGDIFYKYSYKDAGVLMSPWGHDMRSVPVAAGPFTERKDGAMIYQPEFTPQDEAAARTERALRKYWQIVEFSYGFYPKDYDIDWERDEAPWGFGYNFYDVEIYEVSPVHKGASIDTGIGKSAPPWRKELADSNGGRTQVKDESSGLDTSSSLADVLRCRLATIGGL